MLPHGTYAPNVDAALFRDTLFDSHRIRTRIHIHDANENKVASFNPALGGSRVLSGSVQVDATQDVSRSLDLVVLDERRQLSFTKNNPAFIGVYAEHFISVTYGVLVPLGDGTSAWVDVPVFWGPLTEFAGNGAEITLEGQGKEALGLAPNYYARKAFQINEKTMTHKAVRTMFDRIGERRYRMPDLNYKIGAKRNIGPASEPWKVLVGGEVDSKSNNIPGIIAATGAHPHHAFYDGFGQLTIQRLNKQHCFTFDASHILSDPQFSFDSTRFVNHIVLEGAKPKGKGKQPIKVSVSLPPAHPLSPQSLARNGEPRYLTHFDQAPSLKTEKACRDRAHHLLQHYSKFGLDVSFDCLPVPMLEEHDKVTVDFEGNYVEFPLLQFTIPLTHDTPMTIGGHAAVPKRRRRKESPGPSHHKPRHHGPRHKPPHHKPRHKPPKHHKPRNGHHHPGKPGHGGKPGRGRKPAHPRHRRK